MKSLNLLFCFSISIFLFGNLHAQQLKYSKVKIQVNSMDQLTRLAEQGIAFDHFHGDLEEGIEIYLSETELLILENSDLKYDIEIDDVASFIEQRNIKEMSQLRNQDLQKSAANFELGSMGGFYTYSEVLAQLDEMKTLFPNLITSRYSIGTSIEGRTIWAVKISDNPDTDESASEAAVYYDALTHAREPASMAITINFMFHLLENYGTDDEATYLINNREIFVIPVVNPDGYVYNESTNPNGGGMWRKNRRNNSGSCEGVDINRNFDWMWSSNSGSSGNTCSDSYRGTSAFSEPETQAIRDFATDINPPIAFTTHTFQGTYLMVDFSNGNSDYALPAEFSNDCLNENDYLYGDASLILGFASGTTQYWMFDALGTIIWTPEIGYTGFWPAPSEIIPLVEEHLRPFIYISWVAGDYADFQGFNVLNNSQLKNGETFSFNVEVKNKGLTQTAPNVTVDVSSPYANIVSTTTSANYGNIASRATADNTATPFEFSVNGSANVGDQVKFYVDVKQNGTLTRRDSFYVTVGEQNILFEEDGEGSLNNWNTTGSGSAWGTTNEDAYGGTNAIADSPIGNINNNGSTAIQLASSINLTGTNAPRLEYAAKWGHETGSDRTRIQISTNGGSNWTSLSTPHTVLVQGNQGYTGNETWIYESIDLSSYIGQSILVRFATFANSSQPSDGFYFDNFRIVDYSIGTTSTCSDGIQNGDETGVDCGGSCPTACPTCSDGVQNGDETGIDCGGSCPTACTTCNDGIQNGDETGIDCGGSCPTACPTCSDGIQNGDETGIDCGGSCPTACSTCNDGIQNGDETGIDCGGSCPTACPTCSDGIQNGDETGIDCGGSCPTACPTCSDGIQNGDETGIDCGGSCPNSCSGCTTVTIISDDFESGYGNWNDGGSDCFRSSDANYANSGTRSVRLRDNTSTSVATTDLLDLSTYNEITVDFTYIAVSMDNSNEDFWLQISTNGGSTYTTVEEWNRDDEFQNDIRYFENVTVSGPFSTNTRIRFRCDASGNQDWVYLDDIVVTACQGGGGSTCSDGIQNGDETGIDCGGSCPTACPTCSDGIQNGDETGIDCGGSCPTACSACNDGIQNGDETGIDCGGSCPNACPTCTDGIQNGDETGIDCGGSCPTTCPVTYCASSASSTFYEHIQAVAFDGNTNTSGNNSGYADFTGSVTFNASLNSTYSIALTPGFNSSAYNEGWSVWIDYNIDGDFTDAGEQVFTGISSTTLNGNITIPASATTGITRMRVAMQYNSVQNNSCATFQYGEVEDYAVNISSGTRAFKPTLGYGKGTQEGDWMEVYPNPVRGHLLNIKYGSSSDKAAVLRFISIDGKVQKSLEIERQGTLPLDISNMEKGVYLLQLITQDNILTEKIVIQ